MSKYVEQPASEKLIQELTIATDASIGIIAVRCAETEVYRVVDEIYALAQASQVDFKVHTSETGWCSYAKIDPKDKHAEAFDTLKPQNTDKGTADILKAFQDLDSEKTSDEGYFVMLDVYFQFADKVAQTCIRKQAHRAMQVGQRLFLIVPNHAEIPDGISPLIHVIHYGYPTREELSDSLDDVLESIEKRERPELTDEERALIISNGQGMTSYSFETAIALSITDYAARHEVEEERDGEMTTKGSLSGYGAEAIIDMIRHYKMQLLRKTNVLELQPTVDINDVGGLDLFKSWMEQRRSTYTEEAVAMGVTPSRGALVVGPPGTGKSLVAKAAGAALGLPVVRFDVGRVFGSYIGQSEQSMRSVLAMLDAMAPVVLMLDEIDKGFAGMIGGQNDSGTTARVFGTFLTWMQERDQLNRPVFLVMTANRVEGLPPELLRKGRVDEIWSVNVPNAVERAQIIDIHARKRKQTIDKDDMPSLVRITEHLVGAEIEALIEDALVMSFAEGNPGITYEYLEKAKTFLKPMSQTRAQEFENMRRWADTNARPASSPETVLAPPSPTRTGPKAKPMRKRTRIAR